MTTTTAKAKNTDNVTSIKAVTKIERAREVFKRVHDAKFEVPEGSSIRAEFLKICTSDLKMTDSGASTYWQNLSTEAKGGDLYKHAKAPTGMPRGRRPDANREIKKAAARVEKLTSRLDRDNKELQQALAQFNQLSVAPAQ